MSEIAWKPETDYLAFTVDETYAIIEALMKARVSFQVKPHANERREFTSRSCVFLEDGSDLDYVDCDIAPGWNLEIAPGWKNGKGEPVFMLKAVRK